MSIWESIFSSREWGKYPPEELVRIASKFKKDYKTEYLKCLELGPGPGANSLLLIDLFNQYCAIDVSSSAIMKLKKRIISKTDMLLFHGDADEVVPPSNLLEVKDFLERNKIKVDVNMIKNCSHHIPVEALSLALKYIKKII